MSEAAGFTKEPLPGRYELLYRLKKNYEKNKKPLEGILGPGVPEGLHNHGAVVSEWEASGQNLLFNFRSVAGLKEARFYPAPVTGGTSPHYQITEKDMYVLFTDEFGPTEEHRVIVVNNQGR